MGQKINSIGFRLGTRRAWNSIWNVEKNNYSNLFFKDLESRKSIKNILKFLGFFPNHLIIRKSAKKSLIYSRFITASNFSNVEKHQSITEKNTKYLSPFINGFLFNFFKFKLPLLQNFMKLQQNNQFKKSMLFPFISAHALSEFIALQQGLPLRQKANNFKWGSKWGIIKLAHYFFNSKTTSFLSGIKFICAGKWVKTKSGRKQRFIYSLGKLKNQTISAFIDYGFSNVVTKYGMCSLKVWISYKYIKSY